MWFPLALNPNEAEAARGLRRLPYKGAVGRVGPPD